MMLSFIYVWCIIIRQRTMPMTNLLPFTTLHAHSTHSHSLNIYIDKFLWWIDAIFLDRFVYIASMSVCCYSCITNLNDVCRYKPTNSCKLNTVCKHCVYNQNQPKWIHTKKKKETKQKDFRLSPSDLLYWSIDLFAMYCNSDDSIYYS